MTAEKNTYGQILRSSSIVGGSQAANYLIGFARVKLVAMLLGPTGVGLVGLYTSAIGFVGTVSGLGVGSSAVREIVRAYGQGDPQEAARTVIILRRVCWATGFFGWLLAVVFREPISLAMGGASEHAGAIAVLGATLLLSAVSGGQLALLQGLRRIGDLARANVTGAALGSIVTVAIYSVLGKAGIVPALVAAAFVTLASSFWYARRVPVSPLSVSLRETWSGARRLLGLGLAFMWSAVLVAGLDLLIRAIIAHKFGIEGAGIYQAAWALSGMFANFVLSAMGADFYPRLTATIHDRPQAARAVNEQTEIGVLLALPGLLAALTLAPLAIKLLVHPPVPTRRGYSPLDGARRVWSRHFLADGIRAARAWRVALVCGDRDDLRRLGGSAGLRHGRSLWDHRRGLCFRLGSRSLCGGDALGDAGFDRFFLV